MHVRQLFPTFSDAAAAFLSLVLVSSVSAQTVTRVGDEDRLNIATWNIEWFGHAGNGPADVNRQLRHVRAVIDQAGIDLWAVQEIADPAHFNRLLDSLGTDWDGLIRNNCFFDLDQRLGYIFRRGRIAVTRIQQLFNEPHPDGHCYEFAQRPPLRLDVRASFPDTTINVVFINVHMKARTSAEDYNRRVAASGILKGYIDDQRIAGLIRDPVVLLGDYNDRLLTSTRSGEPSPFRNFILDSDGYYSPTRILEQQGKNSWCGNASCTSGSMIDHIVVTRDLFPHYELDSSDHYIELVSEIPFYRSTTSDHLPVYARFEFRTATSTEGIAELPASASLVGTYPNPFDGSLTVNYELGHGSAVNIEMFDVLGRVVEVVHAGWQGPGSHRTEVNAATLPAGVYFIRLTAEDVVETVQIVKMN